MSKVNLDDVKRQIMALMAAPATQQRHIEKLRALSLKKRKAAQQIVGAELARAGFDMALYRYRANACGFQFSQRLADDCHRALQRQPGHDCSHDDIRPACSGAEHA